LRETRIPPADHSSDKNHIQIAPTGRFTHFHDAPPAQDFRHDDFSISKKMPGVTTPSSGTLRSNTAMIACGGKHRSHAAPGFRVE
jgi:hypothetical protein